MLPSKFWSDWSWRDFAATDMSKVIAVLPVAATEQHGPHLPVGVDNYINQGYLARAVEADARRHARALLPVQAIGKSNEHIEFPGTLTFSHETVIRAWTEIGDSVARAGCRKLVFINSHGGNVPVIDIVARELRVQASHARRPRRLAPARPARGHVLGRGARPRHPRRRGRDLADARVPAAHGEDGARARTSPAPPSASSSEFKQLRVTQPVGFGWMASDLTAAGVAGDASKATLRRARPAPITPPAPSSTSCATCRPSISRACTPGPLARMTARPEFRVRARAARSAARALSPGSTRSGAARSPGRSASRR